MEKCKWNCNWISVVPQKMLGPNAPHCRRFYRTVEEFYRTVVEFYRTAEGFYRTVVEFYRTVDELYRTVETWLFHRTPSKYRTAPHSRTRG